MHWTKKFGFLCLILLPLISTHCDGVGTFVWNTQCDPETPFCSHAQGPNSPVYRTWFNRLCHGVIRDAIMASHVCNRHRIGSIFVQKPIGIFCHTYFVNVIVETYYDSDELRQELVQLAQVIKDRSNEEISIVLKVYAFAQPFTERNESTGT